MLETQAQIVQQIKGAKRVLITCQKNLHLDSLASCVAMSMLLKKINIPAAVVVSSPEQHIKKCSFLPGFELVTHSATALKTLTIRVSPKHATIGSLSYERSDGDVVVYLTPTSGSLEESDAKIALDYPAYDLIIICDTPDLSSLGPLYHEQADFFYHTPIINIDHSPANDQYGQINHVDITAVSTTEIIFQLFDSFGEEHLDADIATALLAGMIAKTQSFKSTSVTPRALVIASELVQHGARRDEIIHHLYRQHDLSTLRLWGRVLARLQHDAELGLVWSAVRRDDFQKAGADEHHLPGVIDELIMSSPEVKTVLLLFEKEDGKVGGWLKTGPHLSALELTKQWQGEGSRNLSIFVLPTASFEEAEQLVRSVIKNIIP
jgi:nanoRNase/pAp phosphatase (c-di-AMP/oligoRNAs hydrolase)